VAAIYKPNPNSSRQTALKINEIRKRMASIRNLKEYENHLAVFIGDFNEAPNPQVDRLQASNTPNKSPPRLQQEVDNANSLLHDILDKSSGDIFHPLIDIWGEQHRDQREYTHQVQNSKYQYPSQSRIDLALVKTNTVQHVNKSWIEKNTWDTGMHHKAIGITLNIPIQQNTMKIHRNKTKIIGFNKENTSEHHNNFILELNKQYTNPLKSNKCNIHQTILIAAKATGALRTKGSHQRNWKKTDLIPSNVKKTNSRKKQTQTQEKNSTNYSERKQ